MCSTILLTALALGAPASKESVPESEKIVGDWEVQSITTRGETVSLTARPEDRLLLRFSAHGQLSWFGDNGKETTGGKQSYTIPKSEGISHINVTVEEVSMTRKSLGIMRI